MNQDFPIFTEEDPTYDDLTETNSLASGSVNEILDGIADVQEFRDSVLWDHLLDDLNKHNSTSSEEVSTIKKKPKNQAKIMSSYTSETDFLQQACGGRISRSNSANQLAKSASNDLQKVSILNFRAKNY